MVPMNEKKLKRSSINPVMFWAIVECFYAANVSLSLGSLLRNDVGETFDEILLKQISVTQCIVDC